jgi:hypothetical protein
MEMEESENQFLAGHAPALKVGGMRVPKPKSRSSKDTSLGSDEITDEFEDVYVDRFIFYFVLKFLQGFI